MEGQVKPRARTYRDLNVWQKAVELAEETYRLAKKLPKTEEHGLASQLRRAAISIPANIAEGHGRKGSKEFGRFLAIAHGSLVELETLIALGHRIGYYTAADATKPGELADHTGAMLGALAKSLEKQTRGSAAVAGRQSPAIAAVG
jgi:four helix bundle protein